MGLVAALVAGGATLATPASADDVYGHCTTGGVRLRSEPSTNGAVLGQCDPGERLGARDESGSWIKVYDFDSGVTGWMSKQYYAWG
ncbi:SH3 domain-containing protein [Streptomyces sp. NPDC052396]|uniref:SH3 domain-containing protein n=1 Tax=Streptomyces sp. NPDC052396 TaxID=3365689 RepID=UPI0037D7B455